MSTPCAIVTAVLPEATSGQIMDALDSHDVGVLVTHARGTVLNDHWFKRWLPPISPSKSLMQLIVAPSLVDRVLSTIVEVGNLDLQATGAAFSTPCEVAHLGPQCRIRLVDSPLAAPLDDQQLDNNLSVIYCITSHNASDRVARAAIQAGAHGPIVYYSEGRGLRDRVGWLRITKDSEQEVLMVLVEESDAGEVFDAMSKAAGMHMPGRGFMYRVPIDQGMFNLRSWASHHHHDASMQQIISAIDKLAGHRHWRDQSVVPVGVDGRASGVAALAVPREQDRDNVCLTMIVNRSRVTDLMRYAVDAGAPGLNANYAHFFAPSRHGDSIARVDEEYGILRSVTSRARVEKVCASLARWAAENDVVDLCVVCHDAKNVATYVPGERDFRQQAAAT